MIQLVLGTMTFGESVFYPDVKTFIDAFLDAGYAELDTAYVYNDGICEKPLGEALKDVCVRHRNCAAKPAKLSTDSVTRLRT